MTLYQPPPRLVWEDLLGTSLRWLLDLSWAGQVFHLAELPLEAAVGPDGASVHYIAGLEFGGMDEERLKLFSGDLEGHSVGVTLHLEDLVDVPAMIAESGYNLGTARGQLRLWAEGTSNATIMLDGPLSESTFDTDKDPITGTLEESPDSDSAQYPDAAARVNSTTWPNHDPLVTGEFYPDVFGSPDAAPCLLVDTTAGAEVGLVAGHRSHASGKMKITNHSVTPAESRYCDIVQIVDGLNRPVTTVDLNSGGWTATPEAGGDIWAYWIDVFNVRIFGAMLGEEPIKGAGDVLTWWLQRTSIRWDPGRTATIKGRANQYRIDCYAMAGQDERLAPFFWIQEHILGEVLPVSLRIGPAGAYPVWWDYSMDASAAVANLEQGRNCDRAGEVLVSDLDDTYSTLEILYDSDGYVGEFQGRAVLSGDPDVLTSDTDADPNLYLERAWTLYTDGDQRKRRPALALTTNVVQDGATAEMMLAWKARFHALQRYGFSYLVDQEVAGRLEFGAVVTITDPDRSWAAQLAIVDSLQPATSGQMVVGMVSTLDRLGNPT